MLIKHGGCETEHVPASHLLVNKDVVVDQDGTQKTVLEVQERNDGKGPLIHVTYSNGDKRAYSPGYHLYVRVF